MTARRRRGAEVGRELGGSTDRKRKPARKGGGRGGDGKPEHNVSDVPVLPPQRDARVDQKLGRKQNGNTHRKLLGPILYPRLDLSMLGGPDGLRRSAQSRLLLPDLGRDGRVGLVGRKDEHACASEDCTPDRDGLREGVGEALVTDREGRGSSARARASGIFSAGPATDLAPSCRVDDNEPFFGEGA